MEKPEAKKEITESDVFEMIKDRDVLTFLNNVCLELNTIHIGGGLIHEFRNKYQCLLADMNASQFDADEGAKPVNFLDFKKADEKSCKRIMNALAWLLNNTDLKI